MKASNPCSFVLTKIDIKEPFLLQSKRKTTHQPAKLKQLFDILPVLLV